MNHAAHLQINHGSATTGNPPDPELIERVWNTFVAFLKHRQARITQSRRIILERVLSRDDHFSADQLAADLAVGPNRVSRGTVYRTLALMAQAGIVREIRNADVHTHYEHIYARAHHEHMICDNCGRFIEFDDSNIIGILDQICRQHGFEERTHRITVFGTCPYCKNGEKKQEQ